MTERESKVQTRTIQVVRKYGGYIYKNAQSIFTEKGRPDLAACVPVTIKRLVELYGEDATVGLFVGIEMKRDGHLGDVSDAQKIVGRQIKKAKGIWIAIDDHHVAEALMIRLTEGQDGV